MNTLDLINTSAPAGCTRNLTYVPCCDFKFIISNGYLRVKGKWRRAHEDRIQQLLEFNILIRSYHFSFHVGITELT